MRYSKLTVRCIGYGQHQLVWRNTKGLIPYLQCVNCGGAYFPPDEELPPHSIVIEEPVNGR